MFEEAELSGVLLLAGRKLKEFPAHLAIKYEISDIISAVFNLCSLFFNV
ncbi:unnamed protein product [Brugia timori]|uniref:Uncharacterized protein n=1 Tax=Brugia timori TaxID=42155 RepID=A0A0R3QBZ1_9BILA|nr:unnamed protein product [Brugia timori]